MRLKAALEGLNEYRAAIHRWREVLPYAFRNAIEEIAQEIAERARKDAPVDTGFLRESITIERTPSGATIRVGAEYARYVEFGTDDTEADPFFWNNVAGMKNETATIIRKHIARVA